jgi:inositol oxygenase
MPALVSYEELDLTSDAVDEGEFESVSIVVGRLLMKINYSSVNILKGKTWNDQSEFDAAKDKAQFRQYEDACDRVKDFYKEQHGTQKRIQL